MSGGASQGGTQQYEPYQATAQDIVRAGGQRGEKGISGAGSMFLASRMGLLRRPVVAPSQPVVAPVRQAPVPFTNPSQSTQQFGGLDAMNLFQQFQRQGPQQNQQFMQSAPTNQQFMQSAPTNIAQSPTQSGGAK